MYRAGQNEETSCIHIGFARAKVSEQDAPIHEVSDIAVHVEENLIEGSPLGGGHRCAMGVFSHDRSHPTVVVRVASVLQAPWRPGTNGISLLHGGVKQCGYPEKARA